MGKNLLMFKHKIRAYSDLTVSKLSHPAPNHSQPYGASPTI